MKRILLILFICLSGLINAKEVKNFRVLPVGITVVEMPSKISSPEQEDKRKKTVSVKSYKRKNGTVVKAHKRRPPRKKH